MVSKLALLQTRKQELLNYLEQARNYKSRTISFVNNLEYKLDNKKISYNEYRYKLNRALKERSLQEWLVYYDNIIHDSNSKLIELNNELSRNESHKSSSLYLLITLILVLIGISTLILFEPQLTGLVVYKPGIVI